MEVTMQMLTDSLDQYIKMSAEDYARNKAVHEWAPELLNIAWTVSREQGGKVGLVVKAYFNMPEGIVPLTDCYTVGTLEEVYTQLERHMEKIAEQIMATPVVPADQLPPDVASMFVASMSDDKFLEDLKANGLIVEN